MPRNKQNVVTYSCVQPWVEVAANCSENPPWACVVGKNKIKTLLGTAGGAGYSRQGAAERGRKEVKRREGNLADSENEVSSCDGEGRIIKGLGCYRTIKQEVMTGSSRDGRTEMKRSSGG